MRYLADNEDDQNKKERPSFFYKIRHRKIGDSFCNITIILASNSYPTHMAVNNRLSHYTYFLCVALMCYASFFFYPRWRQAKTDAAISWDVSGYYWYLPSVFIYHDLKGQAFKDSILAKYQPTNT